MDFGLKGCKAVVGASSRGLGRAIAESLAAEGVDLFLTARDETALTATADDIAGRFGVNVRVKAVDMASPERVASLAEEIQRDFGPVDILVNNIGGPRPSAAVETTRDDWQRGFDQLFQSVSVLTHALVGGMRERKFGRIITVTSLSVVEPIDHLVVSTAMRAAVTAFHKTLATEIAVDGVTCHTVMPGVIRTGRIVDLRQARAERLGTSVEEEIAKTENAIPMGRLGKPEELGDVVAFLCSKKASYLTGLNVAVDGGYRKGF